MQEESLEISSLSYLKKCSTPCTLCLNLQVMEFLSTPTLVQLQIQTIFSSSSLLVGLLVKLYSRECT